LRFVDTPQQNTSIKAAAGKEHDEDKGKHRAAAGSVASIMEGLFNSSSSSSRAAA
jgi:hypothetical protein